MHSPVLPTLYLPHNLFQCLQTCIFLIYPELQEQLFDKQTMRNKLNGTVDAMIILGRKQTNKALIDLPMPLRVLQLPNNYH